MRAIRWSVAALALLPLAAAAQAMLAGLVVERRADGQRDAVVSNHLAGPLLVEVSDPRRPRDGVRAVLAAGATAAVGRFGGDGEARLELRATPGEPQLLPPAQTRAYALPLPAGAGWQLSQGFGGRASHRDPANFHALDFAAPAGTPVLAARAGTVMQVVDTWREGGTDEALRERANLVRVLHADGSMAVYAHIATGSARVAPGDAVVPGQVLAAVGSVGWSTAPHLHFGLQFNDGRELLSLPFRMPAAGVD